MQKIAIVTGTVKNQPATPLPSNIRAIHAVSGSAYLCYTNTEFAPNPADTANYASDLVTDAANTTANKGAIPTLTSWVVVTGTSVSLGGFTWSPENSGRSGTLKRDSVNTNLYQFEVAPGDIWSPVDDGNGVERSELECLTKLSFNTAYQITYLYRAFAPGSADAASLGWVLINQIQHTADAGDAGASPPFAREIGAARDMLYTRRTSTQDPLLSNPSPTTMATISPTSWGSWIRVKEQHLFDPTGGTGYHKIWHDDVQIVNYTGNTGYVDAVGPYYKMGIYRAADASHTLRVQIANWTQT